MAEAKCVKQIHEDAVERLLADPSYQKCPDDDKDKPLYCKPPCFADTTF